MLSVLAVATVIMVGTPADEELLRRVLAQHSSSLAALESYSCRIEVRGELLHPKPAKSHNYGRYWYAGGKFRLQEFRGQVNGSQTDETIVGDEAVTVRWRQGGTGGVFARAPAREFASPVSVPDWCMFEFTVGPIDRRLTLAELVTKATGRGAVSRVSQGGIDLIRLVCEWNEKTAVGAQGQLGFRYEIDLDPAVNGLVRTMTKATLSGKIKVRREVLEFAEPLPGVFFPIRLVEVFETNGIHKSTMTATVSELKVNVALSPEWFDPDPQRNSTVYDLVEMKTYKTDEGGALKGATSPLRKVAPKPGKVPGQDAADERPFRGQPSDAEEPSRWSWLFWSAAGLALVGAVLWGIGMWRGGDT